MNVVEEGQLKGTFNGFKDQDTLFHFFGGQSWKQHEHKYHYHHAYMPRAKVINDGDRYFLIVEGINERVEVKRV